MFSSVATISGLALLRRNAGFAKFDYHSSFGSVSVKGKDR